MSDLNCQLLTFTFVSFKFQTELYNKKAKLSLIQSVYWEPDQAQKNMRKPKFSLIEKDEKFIALVEKADKPLLAIWANACVERVLPHYAKSYPKDQRPAQALDVLRSWIETGDFSMKVISKAALEAHAAAREVGQDNAARSAARAAGQTVATAHVKTHAIAAAKYSLQALHRAAPAETEATERRQ